MAGSSVAGCPKRLSFPLTKACFQRGPFAPRTLLRFLATMSLSDSRHGPSAVIYSRRRLRPCCAAPLPGLPGSSTDLSLRAAPSHPGKSGGCSYPLLRLRLQASSNSADWPLPSRNEAETVLLALRLTGSPLGASSKRVAPLHARLATCRMGNSHGEFLSSHKIGQTSPGAPNSHE